MAVTVAEVVLWGRVVGAVAWDDAQQIGSFEYHPQFQTSGIQLAPLTMPLGPRIFRFPNLTRDTYHGLPGLLSDSLPDRFGNLLIDQWLLSTGRNVASFSPVERLCYIGTRGMGALEYRPSLPRGREESLPLDIAHLVELANLAISQKQELATQRTADPTSEGNVIREILRVGTSAGGARAKAIIAWNLDTGEIRSGQVRAPAGFSYWLLKFDGITGNRDKELDDPSGYGRIEYAYYLMAKAAGIDMMESRLWEENGRAHFVTRRFDRLENGEKRFMQSLCAVAHYDFNHPGAYSYEQALQVAQQLGLPRSELLQLFRRAIFNIMARNQDDHTKNIAFLMDKSGSWSLAPAFDITYSYNPSGIWPHQNQMTLNGRRDHFNWDDFQQAAQRFQLQRRGGLTRIAAQIDQALAQWPRWASQAGVPPETTEMIGQNHRRLAQLPRSA